MPASLTPPGKTGLSKDQQCGDLAPGSRHPILHRRSLESTLAGGQEMGENCLHGESQTHITCPRGGKRHFISSSPLILGSGSEASTYMSAGSSWFNFVGITLDYLKTPSSFSIVCTLLTRFCLLHPSLCLLLCPGPPELIHSDLFPCIIPAHASFSLVW